QPGRGRTRFVANVPDAQSCASASAHSRGPIARCAPRGAVPMTDGVRTRERGWAAGGLVLVVVATVSVSACGSPGTRAGADRAVRAVERNFSIRLAHTVAPGLVRFDITGAGPTMHEFNVVR